MGCPGPHSAAGLQPAAPVPNMAHATGPFSLAELQHKPSRWESTAPSGHGLAGEVQTPDVSCPWDVPPHGIRALLPGSTEHSGDPHTTGPERAANSETPQARRGEAGTARPQQGWTLPWDGQRGGQGAGRGLGPPAAPLLSTSPALSQGFETPTLQQSPSDETHSPTPPMLRGHPNPSALPSPCHVRARWAHRGSRPCNVGAKALPATMCHSLCPSTLRRPAPAPRATHHALAPAASGSATPTPGQDTQPLGPLLTLLRPKASGSSRGTP